MKKGDKMTIEQRKKLSLSHKGQAAWNKGIPMSEEAREKASNSKKGKVPWNKGKKCEYVSERNRINNPNKKGELSNTWKGGCWAYIKKQVLIRDNYTCQICGLRDVEIIQVDHIKPKSIFPELRLDLDNLMTMCPNCHARKTIIEKKNKYLRENYE